MSVLDTIKNGNDDDIDGDEPGPISERWDPLGADNEEEANIMGSCSILSGTYGTDTSNNLFLPNSVFDPNRIRGLEEEHEVLTTSLMALTSHFAQVQFRLRQIVDAPTDDRDLLLKNLEEFAFRGIPEITGNLTTAESDEVIHNLERARNRQFELIDRLKRQLTELEKFAYDSGAPVLPQSILVEKQKIIIDELKNKLNLNVSEIDLPQLSSEDLRNQVDTAIGEFVGPLKMKEQLVAQLKTQITDLERFIAFLQCDSDEQRLKTIEDSDRDFTDLINDKRSDGGISLAYNSYSAKKKQAAAANRVSTSSSTSSKYKGNSDSGGGGGGNANDSTPDLLKRSSISSSDNCTARSSAPSCTNSGLDGGAACGTANRNDKETLNGKVHSLMDKASTLLQMFAVAQFGCGSNRFQKNTLKKSSRINHWGDTRAQLEVDIQEIVSLAITLKRDREKLVLSNNQNAISKKNLMQQNNEHEEIQEPEKEQRTMTFANDDYSSDDDSDTGGVCPAGPVKRQKNSNRSNYHNHNNHHTEYFSLANVELTTIVRKHFSVTLQKLIQHGLRTEADGSSSLVPFIGCFNSTGLRGEGGGGGVIGGGSSTSTSQRRKMNTDYDDDDDANCAGDSGGGGLLHMDGRQMHAWELILEYYHIKNGDRYNETPARKLSQSFNLDIVGGNAISNKQSLLSAIGSIIAMHNPYKRSYNSHFKAFVCAGLNSHKLVTWLNLLFQCTDLTNTYYTNWSYVARTGFRDALRSIDRLTKYDFDLPIDLAIRQFQNIKDIFM